MRLVFCITIIILVVVLSCASTVLVLAQIPLNTVISDARNLLTSLTAASPAPGENERTDPIYAAHIVPLCNDTTLAAEKARNSWAAKPEDERNNDRATHLQLAALLHDAGEQIAAKCRQDRGMGLLAEAVMMRRALLGELSPETGYSTRALGLAMAAAQRNEEAYQVLLQSLNIFKALHETEQDGVNSGLLHDDVVRAKLELGIFMCEHGRCEAGGAELCMEAGNAALTLMDLQSKTAAEQRARLDRLADVLERASKSLVNGHKFDIGVNFARNAVQIRRQLAPPGLESRSGGGGGGGGATSVADPVAEANAKLEKADSPVDVLVDQSLTERHAAWRKLADTLFTLSGHEASAGEIDNSLNCLGECVHIRRRIALDTGNKPDRSLADLIHLYSIHKAHFDMKAESEELAAEAADIYQRYHAMRAPRVNSLGELQVDGGAGGGGAAGGDL